MKILLINLSILFTLVGISQQNVNFEENKGQWDLFYEYKLNVNGGRVFLAGNSITYDLYSQEDLAKIADHHHTKEKQKYEQNTTIHGHVYKVNFVGSNNTQFTGLNKHPYYFNYFLGNDQSKWASFVGVYPEIIAKNMYNSIDMKGYGVGANFKYDFVVYPRGNISSIKMAYEGITGISISEGGNLVIKTSINEVIEQKPIVYQEINGEKKYINANYLLTNANIVSFNIGEYDKTKPLIIDPTVIASTYSGTSETIYGHTGTFDDNGNLYSGGAGFSPGGSPVTLGAFQTTYAGNREMCINKYSPDGSSLIYCTYLGGSDDDFPHSLFNQNGNLHVLGTSRSSNFPVTTAAYDQTHNGGSDIVVTILNPSGSALIGSTYVGGTFDDGGNTIIVNYGDIFRGEIVVDALGNSYISSLTSSTNFPVNSGAYQTTNGGGQDGVAIKLDPTLSNLVYSTYLGGTGNDAAYGIKLDGNKTYVSGTAATAFFTATGAYSTHAGQNDCFLIALDNTARNILHGTYFGSPDFEQAFFVEIDRYNDIYILGQTDGTINATPNQYNGGSGIFVAKFDNSLSNHLYTATTKKLSPVAFLVDDCDYIYVSGHTEFSGYSGFGVTSDAFQSSPAGFYLMTLSNNGTTLSFGTYYGTSASHVDGGTSRFDKKGIIYQATCSDPGFPTTPSAFANNSSQSWDVSIFKIDFEFGAQPAQFAPFLANETFKFEDLKCIDIVAYGFDSVRIELNTDAYPFGAYATLPPQKPNGKYDFQWIDSNTNTQQTDVDVDVRQTTPTTFVGYKTAGARLCWNPTDCKILEKEGFKLDLISIAMRCDSTIDSLERSVDMTVTRNTFDSFVPNVFSPNGDGKNDYFTLPANQFDKCYDALTIKIYNRWGILVFESADPLFKWDGTDLKGTKLNPGVYYMLLEGVFGSKDVTSHYAVTLFK